MKWGESNPGVFTEVTRNPSLNFTELNEVISTLKIKSGDHMDFNSFIHVAQATAKHLGYDDIEKRIESFYGHFEGQPQTIRTVTMFWLMLMKGLRE